VLQATLVLFLVEIAWANLWAAAAENDWATPAAHWGQSTTAPMHTLPYMRPNTPGDRALRWLAHTTQWWREHLRPSVGSAASTIIICIVLGVTLSAILGWPAMALSAASAAIVQLGLVVGRGTGRTLPALKATIEIGLAWLLAHVIFAPLTIPSILLAAAFTAAYGAGLTLIERGQGAALWNAAQFAAAGLLTLMRMPVAAVTVLLMTLAQMLLEPALRRGASGVWFVHSSQAWLMAAMLAAAVAIS